MFQICCNLGQDYWVLMFQYFNRGLKVFGERREYKFLDIFFKQISELQGSFLSRFELWVLEVKFLEIKEEGCIIIKSDVADLGRIFIVDRLVSFRERIILNFLIKVKYLFEKIGICFMLMLFLMNYLYFILFLQIFQFFIIVFIFLLILKSYLYIMIR